MLFENPMCLVVLFVVFVFAMLDTPCWGDWFLMPDFLFVAFLRLFCL